MKVPWQPQIACFSSVAQNNVFVVKICKYAPYEGIILRSPKASQPLPGWRGMEEVHWTWSNLWATLNQNHRQCDRCHKTVVIHPNDDTDDTGDIDHYILKMSMLAVWQQFCGNCQWICWFSHICVWRRKCHNDVNERATWTGAWSSLWNGFPMRERIARLGKDLPTTWYNSTMSNVF